MMTDVDGRRWTRRFVTILLVALVAQLLLPLVTVLGVSSTVRSRGDDHGTILVMIILMLAGGLIPLISMIVLMVSGLRRARAIGEAWLTKTLLVLACLGSITFFFGLMAPFIFSFGPRRGLLSVLPFSFFMSGMPLLLVICLALRRPQAWNPRHREPAIAIAAVCGLVLFASVLPAANNILGPILRPLGLLPLVQWLGSLLSFLWPNIGQPRHLYAVARVLLAAALWWTMLVDDDVPSDSRIASPRFLAILTAVLVVVAWQTTNDHSLLAQMFRPTHASILH